MQAWVIVERGEKNAKTREEKFAGAEIGVSCPRDESAAFSPPLIIIDHHPASKSAIEIIIRSGL